MTSEDICCKAMYKVLTFEPGTSAGEIERVLNFWASAGWEIKSVGSDGKGMLVVVMVAGIHA